MSERRLRTDVVGEMKLKRNRSDVKGTYRGLAGGR